MKIPACSIGWLLLAACLAVADAVPTTPPASPIAAIEQAFLDYLGAVGGVAFIESGKVERFEGRGLATWQRLSQQRRAALDRDLGEVASSRLAVDDAHAVAAMRRSLEALAADETTAGVREHACRDAGRRDAEFGSLRAALVSCYAEYGDRLQFEGRVVDRGTVLQMLHVIEQPARRKALFDAFGPLWTALNGRNEPDSPYRRMIAMAADEASRRGSEIDAAARAIGVETDDVERWLVQILEAWRDASPSGMVEPWDYRYLNSRASLQLEAKVPAESLLSATGRFYRDLGADLDKLAVVFDLEPRPDKSPFAYTDFLKRGRVVDGQWQRPVARVVGLYPTGGLFSLNELVHESGHAAHVSAIRTRPAYMDWPDTLFLEAVADVSSWSIYEPAWQRGYLGAEVPAAMSLRSLFGDVMLDVAWALFELRMLRNSGADPNELWTDITSRYLRIVPHTDIPWWAMRVQLASNPGYMVNYGLGAILTAEIRARTREEIGPFDAGNPKWYGWLSDQLLQFGSERDTRSLMQDLLGRPLSPDALLRQIQRCQLPD